MRGLLVSQILAKNLKLKHTDAKQSAALTLMSTDVEGILDNVRTSHDIWLSGVEISASLYFISTLINEAFFLPMFPIFSKFASIPFHNAVREPVAELEANIFFSSSLCWRLLAT